MGIFLQREGERVDPWRRGREIERERKDSSFFFFLFWREVLGSQRSSLCRVFIEWAFSSYTDIKTREQYFHLLLLVLKYYIYSSLKSWKHNKHTNSQTCWSSLFLMASQKEGTAMFSGTSLKEGK